MKLRDYFRTSTEREKRTEKKKESLNDFVRRVIMESMTSPQWKLATAEARSFLRFISHTLYFLQSLHTVSHVAADG
ncbi:hypothetical protein CEXT_564941 [Caerostris extrusa]|uniref:Uncharacterized protein n=1 Tax=Caerostris extrusa TaxID=172846 RepID=A0AAV4NKZ9_CAEEX|nr:hypothetical protein CEXT_564941 [Caerostris extrusa]